ncbi:SDR family NAD(P)-dependent oxidoreductase, partial [bacterium]|nr:SDR family NAD(P)-dependent oxidoreductase [bacterium]
MKDTPRSALVTGGAQGIGKGIAQRLLKDAWQVAIIDADDEAGRETVRELSAFGSISFLPADTRDEPAVAAAVAAAVARFGRLDAL